MMERFNKTMGLVREGLQYSIFEGLYLITVIIDGLDGQFHTWWLFMGALLAVLWTMTTFTSETKAEIKRLVLDREVFMTDFAVSATLLTLIALLIRHENIWIFGSILLAAGQNLRYSYLSMQWLLEDRREQRRKDGNSDDSMR